MQYVLDAFKQNGVEISCPIDKIGFYYNSIFRGREIKHYLANKQNNKNFVILDDEYFDFLKHFSSNKIIKTNIYEKSLSMDQVKHFLSKTLDNNKNLE